MASNLTDSLLSGVGGAGTSKGGAAKPKKHGSHKGLLKILDLLDTAGSYTRSAVKEGVDALSGKDDVSWKEFLRNAAAHKTTADYLGEYGVKNRAVKLVGGLVGDIALDPLTYLAPETKFKELGRADEVVRTLTGLGHAAEAAGDVAKAERALAAADDVARLGKGALANHPEVLSELGAKGGLMLNVPGTGHVAQKLRIAKEATQIPLVSIEHTGQIGQDARKLLNAVRSTETGKKVAGVLGREGDLKQIINGVLESKDLRPHQAAEALDIARVGQGTAAAAGAAKQTEFRELVERIIGDGGDVNNMLHALEGDTDAIRALGVHADEFRALRDSIYEEANSIAGRKWLAHREGYAPHVLTDDAKEFVKRNGAGGGRISAERGRTIEGTLKEINGAEHQLFKTDPIDVMTHYIDSVYKRAGQIKVETDLKNLGLVKDRYVVTGVKDEAKATVKNLKKYLGEKAAKQFADKERPLSEVLAEVRDTSAERVAQVAGTAGVQIATAGALRNRANDTVRAAEDALGEARRGRAAFSAATTELSTQRVAAVVEHGDTALKQMVNGRLAKIQEEVPGLWEQAAKARFDLEHPQGRVAELTRLGNTRGAREAAMLANQEALLAQSRLRKLNEYTSKVASVLQRDPELAKPHIAGVMTNDVAGDLAGAMDRNATLLSAWATKVHAEGKYAEYVGLRKQADEAYKVAAELEKSATPRLGKSAKLIGDARARAADMREAGMTAVRADKALAQLKDAGVQRQFADLLKTTLADRGWRELANEGLVAPNELAEFLTKMSGLTDHREVGKFVQFYDKFIGLWKAAAVASPGFLSRNLTGATMNMWLDGVKAESLGRFRAARSELAAARATGDLAHLSDDAKIVQAIQDVHLIGSGGQAGHEVREALKGERSLSPLSQKFAPYQWVRGGNAKVEDLVRGTHAFDVMAQRGGSIEDAIATVFKFHFNYEDLSAFEQTFAKRVVPFWTFTARNLPLQLELLIQEPRKMKRFLDVARNIESLSPPEAIVPGYFTESGGVRLPFHLGGGQNYLTPDLPITQASNVIDALQEGSPSGFAKDLATNVSSPLRVPVEMYSKRQFYKDIPLTNRLTKMPLFLLPAAPLLQLTGQAVHSNGQWFVRENTAYAAESAYPLLGRGRRLLPNEKKYQDRWQSTWLSFVLGLSTRTNTEDEQSNEKLRRSSKTTQADRDAKRIAQLLRKS